LTHTISGKNIAETLSFSQCKVHADIRRGVPVEAALDESRVVDNGDFQYF